MLKPNTSKQWAWKLYSVLLTALLIWTIVDGGLKSLNLLGGVVSLLLLAPLIGFSWRKKIVPAWIGGAALILNVVVALFLLVYLGTQSVIHLASIAVTAVLFIPYSYACFVYGFQSRKLFARTSALGL